MAARSEVIEVAGRAVTLSNPDKVYFPKAGITKRQLAAYYMAVAAGALQGAGGRPMLLKRFVNGIDEPEFFQKRAPESRPDWIETVEFTFPSGRSAQEIVLRDAAQLLWVVNLGCIDLNPHPVRAEDMEHPDELRVDLDPVPGVPWKQIVEVANLARDVLSEFGLVGYPKTSGSRGIHVYARILPQWGFDDVRRAALALAREIERRAPDLATSKWWKEERHGVFLDYNQNARDRTTASAYSVRPTQDARVSMPLTWTELEQSDPADYTLFTVPQIFANRPDPHADMDKEPGDLTRLLALADSQSSQGLSDAPWPPHHVKKATEPRRVRPSRAQVIEIARAARKDEALEGLERWKARHPDAARHLQPEDVLVDAMRGRSSTWTRVRINLRRVPVADRPAPDKPDPDDDLSSR